MKPSALLVLADNAEAILLFLESAVAFSRDVSDVSTRIER